jgi:acetyltransferase
MQKSDYLRALLAPASIALVGASGKAGSNGRIVLENLLGGGYEGDLHIVNPGHRRLFARRSYSSLTAIAKPVDLALIVTPTAVVPEVLGDAARASVKAAIIFSAPPVDGARRGAGTASSWPSRPRAAFGCSVPNRSA